MSQPVYTLAEYTLLAASSLFVIVDPLATIPAFLAMTPTDTPETAHQNGAALLAAVMARRADRFSPRQAKWIFKFLGITMAGLFNSQPSVVLLLVALDMLARPNASRVHENQKKKNHSRPGKKKRTIAVARLLRIPMACRSGRDFRPRFFCIRQAINTTQTIALYVCILAVSLASYIILHLSGQRRTLAQSDSDEYYRAHYGFCCWRLLPSNLRSMRPKICSLIRHRPAA